MIEIHGPSYRYSQEVLKHPEYIWVRDHHYDADNQCYHVEKLLENSECDPQQHLLVFDHVNIQDGLTKYPYICFPSFLARENKEFVHQQITPDWNNKTFIFNFMINKPRSNRLRLLRLVEEHKLTNYQHTLTWKTNNINSIPINNYIFGSEIRLDRGIRNGSFKNAHTYKELLQKKIFEPTCISLITEPAYYEKECIVTEKTLMALYAGTVPIWVGGWRIPDYMSSMGFDVFDDIVDHSYQNNPDAGQRCNLAIERNIKLLTNFELTYSKLDRSRLQHNYDLLQQNVFLKDVLKKATSPELQSIVAQELL
tara:strand:- start:38 stop:967 length:930 start_codon:yes stop_codon:yes gene_type:complete